MQTDETESRMQDIMENGSKLKINTSGVPFLCQGCTRYHSEILWHCLK